MKEEPQGSKNCSIIDEFIDQGVPAPGAGNPPVSEEVKGCSLLTEFIGQGAATGGAQSVSKTSLAPASGHSEGCAEVTTYTNQGAALSPEDKNLGKGAPTPGDQQPPRLPSR